MNIFDKVSSVKNAKTKDSQTIAYTYAVILAILVVAQLLTFDQFLSLLESFALPGGIPVAHLFGGLIVACEVLALPFLLRFKLSPLMRIISMVSGWLVPLLWLKLTLWQVISASMVSNVGFLGSVVNLIPGWWTVFVSIALGVLAAWSSWGLWPFETPVSKQSKK